MRADAIFMVGTIPPVRLWLTEGLKQLARILSHQNPVVLNDGKTVLFTIWYGNIAKAQIAATRLGDGKVTKVGVAGTEAIGVVDGQLIYMRAA